MDQARPILHGANEQAKRLGHFDVRAARLVVCTSKRPAMLAGYTKWGFGTHVADLCGLSEVSRRKVDPDDSPSDSVGAIREMSRLCAAPIHSTFVCAKARPSCRAKIAGHRYRRPFDQLGLSLEVRAKGIADDEAHVIALQKQLPGQRVLGRPHCPAALPVAVLPSAAWDARRGDRFRYTTP